MGLLTLIPTGYRIIALVLMALALYGAGWFRGNEHGTKKLTEYIGKQAVEAVRITAARGKIVTLTETKYRDRSHKIYERGATIEKEVPVYVTKDDDAVFAVPLGFVREYNAAWSNTPAGPPAESDRGPSGVPISEVAAADANNATACHAYKA